MELNANFLCSRVFFDLSAPFYKIPHNYEYLPRSIGAVRGQKSTGPDWTGKLTVVIKPNRFREHRLNSCSNEPAGFSFGALSIFELGHSMSGHRATCFTFPQLAKLFHQKL
jgi:hypothetical protein